jgi:hypothetical protein
MQIAYTDEKCYVFSPLPFITERHPPNVEEVDEYMKYIGYPEYAGTLIYEGYDSLYNLKFIRGIEHLEELGIDKEGHRYAIWERFQLDLEPLIKKRASIPHNPISADDGEAKKRKIN